MVNIVSIILTISNCIVWTINSVSFWQIGIKMPEYIVFANWVGIIPYMLLIPFLCIRKYAILHPEKLKIHLLFILCSFLSTLGKISFFHLCLN
jgi:hypothetical protein